MPRVLLGAMGVQALLITVAVAVAHAAAPAFDIRGSWQGVAVNSDYSGTVTWKTENCTTGAIAGSGSGGGSSWPASGTIDSTTVSMTFGPYEDDPGYTAFGAGSFTDADHIVGTFHDTSTFKNAGGDFQLVRTSGPPQDGRGCTSSHPTRVTVTCTYTVATSVDTCTATVGDIGAAPTTPTGTVKFTKSAGGFPLGDTCTLRTTPSAPSTASCSVQYQAPFGSVSFPRVTAAFSGDGTHPRATASTTFLILGGPIQYATTEPGTVAVETQVPADGTSVEVCATVPSGTAANSSTAAVGAGSLADEIRKLAGRLPQSSPAAAASATTSLQRLIDQAAGPLSDLQDQIAVLLRSGRADDQAQAARLQAQVDDLSDAVTKAIRAEADACKVAVGRTQSLPSAQAASSRRGSTRIGYTRLRGAKRGRLTLTLKLGRAALRRAAGRRSRVTVYVRINTVLPSGLIARGWPRSTVQKLVLTRDGRRVR